MFGNLMTVLKQSPLYWEKAEFMCYIITEWFFLLIIFVNYILSFGLVGLWTIWLSAGAGAHIEYSSRSRTKDITITNVIIKTPDR